MLVKPPTGALQHTPQILALAFGLAPDSLRAPLAAKLVAYHGADLRASA